MGDPLRGPIPPSNVCRSSIPLIPTPTHVYSLEDVRIPRLRDVTIEARGPKALMQLKLIDTSVLSLGLTRQRVHGEPDSLIEEL